MMHSTRSSVGGDLSRTTSQSSSQSSGFAGPAYKNVSYRNGDQYEGYWEGDRLHRVKHGQGKFTWANGDVYNGEWKRDEMHGEGVFTWANGNQYDGEWVHDKMEGRGTYRWAKGSFYEGEWKADLKHGRGRFSWPDGSCYEGEWASDLKHGHGEYRWANGDVHSGEYRNGKKNGKGTFTFANSTKFEGVWKDDVPRSTGIYTFPSGERAVGIWQQDPRGSVFVCEDNEDIPHEALKSVGVPVKAKNNRFCNWNPLDWFKSSAKGGADATGEEVIVVDDVRADAAAAGNGHRETRRSPSADRRNGASRRKHTGYENGY